MPAEAIDKDAIAIAVERPDLNPLRLILNYNYINMRNYIDGA
jgi:hypothetical protein